MTTQAMTTELTLDQLDAVNGGAIPLAYYAGAVVVGGVAAWLWPEDAGDAAGGASTIKDKMEQTPEERLAERLKKSGG